MVLGTQPNFPPKADFLSAQTSKSDFLEFFLCCFTFKENLIEIK